MNLHGSVDVIYVHEHEHDNSFITQQFQKYLQLQNPNNYRVELIYK